MLDSETTGLCKWIVTRKRTILILWLTSYHWNFMGFKRLNHKSICFLVTADNFTLIVGRVPVTLPQQIKIWKILLQGKENFQLHSLIIRAIGGQIQVSAEGTQSCHAVWLFLRKCVAYFSNNFSNNLWNHNYMHKPYCQNVYIHSYLSKTRDSYTVQGLHA